MHLSYDVRSLYRYRFGVFELEAHTGELRRNGIKLRLQDQPYQILLKLLEHAGQTVTREQLRAALWPADTFVDFETGLNTTIKRLRETLGDSAENPTFIETVPKRGYRFIAPVTAPDSGSESGVETVAPAKSVRLSTVLKLGAVLILAILSVFAFRHWRTSPPLPAVVLDFTQLTSDGQAKQGPLLSDGSRIYFSEVLPAGRIVAQVSAKGGQTTTIPTMVSNPRPADISPDRTELLILSGDISEKAEPLAGSSLWILPVAGGSARPVDNVLAQDAVWGERAETILYLNGHDLYAVNRDGSVRRKLLSVSGYLHSLRRSANSQLLRFTMTTRAMGGTSSIWEVSASGASLREVVPGLPGSDACCGAWMSGDHGFLFQWTRAGRTDLWELPSNRAVLRRAPIRLTAGPMNVSEPSAGGAPNEAFVVGSIPRGELVKYDPQTAELVPYLSGISAEGVEVSRDGNCLAYTLFPEGTLWRSNITGTERVQLTFPPMRAFLPRWSPDGRQIAFIGGRAGERWTNYVIPADGGVARQMIPGNDQTADATWMPDNKYIVFGPWKDAESRGIKVLDLRTNQVHPLPGATGMWSPRTSPDGRYIAALSEQDSKLMLFDTRTEKWEELSALSSGYPSWSRNGKFLYFQVGNRGIEHPSRVVRIRISDRRLETVLDLNSLDRLSIGTFMSWTGLAPDDSVVLSRNNSTQEIYAVKW